MDKICGTLMNIPTKSCTKDHLTKYHHTYDPRVGIIDCRCPLELYREGYNI